MPFDPANDKAQLDVYCSDRRASIIHAHEDDLAVEVCLIITAVLRAEYGLAIPGVFTRKETDATASICTDRPRWAISVSRATQGAEATRLSIQANFLAIVI